jgi:hypothetical protein
MKDALCKKPEYRQLEWFPNRGERGDDVKAICNQCPVEYKCLVWALENNVGQGVLGGTSGADRRVLRRQYMYRQRRTAAEAATQYLNKVRGRNKHRLY